MDSAPTTTQEDPSRFLKSFSYTAVNKTGIRITGVIKAVTRTEATQKIIDMGLFHPSNVEEQKPINPGEPETRGFETTDERKTRERNERMEQDKVNKEAARRQLERNTAEREEDNTRMALLVAQLKKIKEEGAKSAPTPNATQEIKPEEDSPEVANLKLKLKQNRERPFYNPIKYFTDEESLIDRIAFLEEIQKNAIQGESKRREREIKAAQERAEEEKLEKERIEAIEKDKKINPFKWSLVENMSDKTFEIIFGYKKEKVSLEGINEVLTNEGINAADIWNHRFILEKNLNTVRFTPNGLTLQLQNIEEVKGEDGIETTNPKAKYKLAHPLGGYYNNGEFLDYEKGVERMKKYAGEYQDQQSDRFDEQTEQRELKSISTENKRGYLEARRKNKILEVHEVKHDVQYHSEKITSLQEWERTRAAEVLQAINESPLKYYTGEVQRHKSRAGEWEKQQAEETQQTVDRIVKINAKYDRLISDLGK